MPMLRSAFDARLVLAAVSLAASGCGSSPTVPPAATPPPTQAVAPPSSVAPPSPAASPTPPPRNQSPAGVFRFTPRPTDYDHDIHIGAGDTVRVNGAEFTDPNGDPLYLTVDWGDGESNHIACGACRLEHEYRKLGIKTLIARITDLKSRPVDTQMRIHVE